MSRKIFAVFLVALCFLPLTAIQTTSADAEPKIKLVAEELNSDAMRISTERVDMKADLTLHVPIYINGNSQFIVEQNGVVSGNGTEENPYIIEGWDINAGTAHGIYIINTDIYFIIRNCIIHDGKNNSKYGILFYNVSNGKIDNVTSYNNRYGIYLRKSSNNTVTSCCAYDNLEGIELSSTTYLSSNNSITNCIIYNNSNAGIYLAYVSSNQIVNCSFYNDYDGIYLIYSSDNNIINCNISNNAHTGISLYYSSNVKITTCVFYDNPWDGILIRESPNNIIINCNFYNNHCGMCVGFSDSNSNDNFIYHNNFINNAENVYDTCANFWHNETLNEGNYWSDYTGVDADGDGIGNTPYYIAGGSNCDNYPLMYEYLYKCDLAVTSDVKLKSTSQGLQISANVTNRGVTTENVVVEFYANQIAIGMQNLSLQKGVTVTAVIYWQAQPGAYTFTVKLDPGDAIKEINELNNEKTLTRDLCDAYFSQDPVKTSSEGAGIRVNITLANAGPVEIGPPIYVYVNKQLIYTNTTLIQPNSNVTITFMWYPPSGDHLIEVYLDPNNIFVEADKTNNFAEKSVGYYFTFPDLSVEEIKFSVDLPDEEEIITVSTNIKNIGQKSSLPIKVKFFDDATLFAELDLASISVDDYKVASAYWVARESHTVKVIIDIQGQDERNPDNNIAERYLEVTKKADMAVGNITTDPTLPYETQSVLIYAEILNLGNATGEGNVTFYDDGVLIGWKSTGGVLPQSSVIISTTWPEARSNHQITVKVNCAKKEKDTTNNEKSLIILQTLEPRKPDLTITTIYFDPSPPIYNETCRICVNISNVGNVTSSSATLEIYDGATLIKNVTIQPLLSGSSKIYSIDWLAKKGATIYVTITGIDDSNIVNNAESVYVSYVARADIAVESIRFSKELPVENETITIYADLRNTGDAPSKEAIVKFYANNILIEQKQLSSLQPNQSISLYVLWNAQAKTSIKATVEYEDTSAVNNVAEKALSETTHPVEQTTPSISWQNVSIWAGIGAGIVGAIGVAFLIGRHGIASLGIKKTGEELITKSPYHRILNYTKEFPGSTIKAISEDLGMPYMKTWKHVHKLAEERRGKLLRLIKKEGEKDIWVYPEEICVPRLLPPQREILQKLIRHADGGIPPSLLHDMIGTRWGKLQDYMKGTTTIIGLEQTGYVVSRTIGERTKYLLNPDLKKVIDVLQKNPDTTARWLEDATKIKLGDIKKYLDMLVAADIITRKGVGEEARYNLKIVMG